MHPLSRTPQLPDHSLGRRGGSGAGRTEHDVFLVAVGRHRTPASVGDHLRAEVRDGARLLPEAMMLLVLHHHFVYVYMQQHTIYINNQI